MSICAEILANIVLVGFVDAPWALMLVKLEGTNKIWSYLGSFL